MSHSQAWVLAITYLQTIYCTFSSHFLVYLYPPKEQGGAVLISLSKLIKIEYSECYLYNDGNLMYLGGGLMSIPNV